MISSAITTVSIIESVINTAPAHASGKAINVSKTTAPHAISYALTVHFGVPHGQAVALTIGALMIYNAKVSREDSMDPRGPAHVHSVLAELVGLLGAKSPESARDNVNQLIASIGAPTCLRDVGVTEADVRRLAEQVNVERLANNPRRLTNSDLVEVLHQLQ